MENMLLNNKLIKLKSELISLKYKDIKLIICFLNEGKNYNLLVGNILDLFKETFKILSEFKKIEHKKTFILNKLIFIIDSIIFDSHKNLLKKLIKLDELIQRCLFFLNIEPKKILIKSSLIIKEALNSYYNYSISSKHIHYFWIGDINYKFIDYIELWSYSDNRLSFSLWYDSTAFLIGELRKFLITSVGICSKDLAFCSKMQKDMYCYLMKKVELNYSIDESIIEYLLDNGMNSKELIKIKENNEKKIRRFNSYLSSKSIDISLHDFNELINKKDNISLKKMYLIELFFRVNIAASSDIARIIILKSYGGIYMDLDTLPYIKIPLDDSYKEDLEYINLSIEMKEMFELTINQLALNKLNNLNFFKIRGVKFNYINKAREKIPFLYKKYLTKLESNLEKTSGIFLKNLSEVKMITSKALNLSLFDDVFYSNVIVANKNSEVLNIAIELICNSYNVIIDCIENDKCTHDFNDYRFDGILNNSRITLFLTGPALFFNSLCLFIESFFDLPRNISTMTYSRLVKENFSFTEQIIKNEEGFMSSWMNCLY